MNKYICIIVVFYNPSEKQKKQVEFLSKHFDVIVVDNSDVSNKIAEGTSLRYYALCENRGIAFAQNYGIKEAQKRGFTHILFQDQDSTLANGEIAELFNEYEKTKDIDSSIGAIGPLIVNESSGNPYKHQYFSGSTDIVSSIISSGMLVEMETLKTVGLMEEDLFIDNVDHEWCWRAASKGYRIYMTNKALLAHNVGQYSKKIGRFQIIKSAPFRSYYKFRNNLILMCRGYVPFKWKIKTISNMFFEYIFNLISFKNYGDGWIKFSSLGICDAIKGKRGPMPCSYNK